MGIRGAILVAVLLVAQACAKRAPAPREAAGFPLLEFELTATARKLMDDDAKAWVKGDVLHEGLRMRGVALRLKGQRTLRPLGEKPSLKLRMDKGQHKGRTLLGRTAWTLDNLVEDPSMMRAHLAYKLATAVGLAAPTTRYVRVRIDGRDEGIYLLVDAIDDAFLERHFGSAKGPLYEGEYGCDVKVGKTDCFDLESGKDPERTQIVALTERVADGAPLWEGAEPVFSLEHLALVLAFGAYVGDFDGYHQAHNYRLYRNPQDGRWNIILSGLDRVFIKRLPPFSGAGILAKRCFEAAPCREAYRTAWKRIGEAATELDPKGTAERLSKVMPDAQKPDAEQLDSQAQTLQSYLENQQPQIGAR
tara:strand:+ start:50371 stop:51456 length:1086 start_codon:yes stop_codon:yes gene_type:complete